MMQKIVVEVRLCCDKCRTKAMKIAASVQGVNQLSMQGVDRDQLEVIGDGIDSVCLTRDLRKKLGYANIVQVEPAANIEKPLEKENTAPEEEGKGKAPTPFQPPYIVHPIYYYPVYPEYCHESSSDGCSVV